ncbi:desampylase [soil metagenome]
MKHLLIPVAIRDAMIAQARSELPNECCGLLAGHDDTVTHHVPLINELASPTRFRTSPQSLFLAMKQLRDLKLDTAAFYHSHPTSEPVPSRRDIEEANWPGVAMVIVSLMNDDVVLKAWQIDGEVIRSIDISDEPCMK